MRDVIQTINKEFLETVAINENGTDAGLVGCFFGVRSLEVSTAISSHAGYKLVFSPGEGEDILEVVKRGLLLADLVILNHDNVPTEPVTALFAVPEWFPKKDYDYSSLDRRQVPPHLVLGGATLCPGSRCELRDGTLRGVPAIGQMVILPQHIANWCLTEGRNLLLSGDVVYDPLLPPASWEQYLFSRGVNFQTFYEVYRLLPRQQSHLDEHVARALLRLDLPVLQNIDLKTLQKIKRDERDAFLRFRTYMTSAFNDLRDSAGSENLDRELDRISEEKIRPGLEELRALSRKISKLRVAKLLNILFLSAPTVLSLFLSSPDLKVLGPTLTVAGLAKEYLDHFSETIKNRAELESHPLYLLWRVAGDPSRDDQL